jgi:hypothetical protein
MPNTLPDTVPAFCWADGVRCEVVRVLSPTDDAGRRFSCVIDEERARVEVGRAVPAADVRGLIETVAKANHVRFSWASPRGRKIPLFPTTDYPAFG